MHNGKCQCRMTANCTYHLPAMISKQLNKSHTKSLFLDEESWTFFNVKKSGESTISRNMTRVRQQEDWAEKRDRR